MLTAKPWWVNSNSYKSFWLKAAFTNLPGIKDGKKIEYSVVETNTPEGYTSKVEKIDDDNVTEAAHENAIKTPTTFLSR